VTRWAAGNSRPYREPGPLATSVAGLAEVARLRQSRLNLLTASIPKPTSHAGNPCSSLVHGPWFLT
jgi:hypothetical protein